jgi:hypothetical protein
MVRVNWDAQRDFVHALLGVLRASKKQEAIGASGQWLLGK